jgi:hypothetical protein
MSATQLYRDGVTQALAGFQLIEEELKNYLEMHFECVRLILGGRLHFDFSRRDYQDAALGRLINVFSKVCPNKELVTDLRAVVKHRDHVAHQALLRLYSDKPPSDAEYLPLLSELNEVVQLVSRLLQRIVDEMAKLPKVLDSA